ncbi:conserved Plasmodium protein, unknown function [Plasmodium knowlesi strain H]|uniref:Uncharacterized protein n=3 Tax=Plasmodium knowlesi TaxID=5850 RepID=A0A5K1U2I5_PLAKH|nr:conserved Plasmodium protein, unknown function [Plasmodium knowlesi strain H]OTN63638.1 Uncharacterized protein PKNOH_S140279200 [Plasmodium knowlesi]CAA9991203.1 conserved Plasmodium protein, unknown function [Plasmodium knowlesi strain H]SBO26260.1 conserved Plasmodium protein, unknown function [Plasmodium knowlesi strain H]SBO29410.1 conserved Plasmodium protein, unknown function [Plasmodium knowlesi strain H]VVS80677.1 conserved Plasmodium protein, unknown function [Plasmodium knowlesi |eukprot:XP_002262486.1 hypothetical protein, conserved in Plasmodium species [Plasmodium knowlesi strain H]
MEKNLEKGIAIIRNLAQKYKKTILQRLNPKTQKSINKKKKRKKKHTFKNFQKKQNDRKRKEEKMKKLDNYLINQENELDFHENYSLFSKFNANADNLFYNPHDNNMKTHLISKKAEGKNGESKDTPVKDNFLDSLNSLKFRIKQKIQENNDLLSLQTRNMLRQSSKEQLKGNSSWGPNKIATPGNNAKRALKKANGLNKEQIDNVSTKMKKNKNWSEAEKTFSAKCGQTCSTSFPHQMGGKDKGVSPLPVNSGQIIDDALFPKDELFTEGESNTLVFGKNNFESINKIVEVSLKEKEQGKNGKMGEAERSLSSQFIQQCRNEQTTPNQLGESCADDFFKDENNKDNQVTPEKNFQSDFREGGGSRLRTANPDDVSHPTENAQGGKAGEKNISTRSEANHDLDFLQDEATPLKEDNCFDLFFNETMATPTIFQRRRH